MADDLIPAATMPDGLPTGTVLGDTYEIIRQIALGGMAEVYKAKNVHTDEPVAVKVVLPEFARDQTITALFKKEATILSRLHNEAIVHYHAFSVDRDLKRPYLVMEFVDGTPLSDMIRNTPMSPSRVRQLMVRIALGLSAAHELGVVHRDLSPDNVILPDGDVSKTKIIDFGIAKATVGEGTLLGGKFAGKYNFVSPEQLGLYGGDVTERSDIYSLGLVLAAALLGKPLEMSGSHADVIDKRRVIPDLSGIDPSLRPIISSMLEPEPDRRPRNMRSIIDMFSSPPKLQDTGTVFGGDMPVIADDPWGAPPPPSRSIPPSGRSIPPSRSIPPGRSLPPQTFQDAPQAYQTAPQGYQTTPPGYQDPQQGYQDPQRGRSIPPAPAERTSLSPSPGPGMPTPGGRTGPPPAIVGGPAGADSPFGPFNPSGPAVALPPIGKNGKVIGEKKGGAPIGLIVGGLVVLLVIGGGGYFAFSQHLFGGAAPSQVDIATAPQPTPTPTPAPPTPAPTLAPTPTVTGGTGNLDGSAQPTPAPTPVPTRTPVVTPAPAPSPGPDNSTSTAVTPPPATPQPTPEPATPQSPATPPANDVASTGSANPPTPPANDVASTGGVAGQLDTAAQRIAWLNSYAFDGCQYATATKVAASSMDIEAFGTAPSDFQALSDSFQKQSGFAPHIAVRQINDIECPAVDFIDSTKSFAKTGLTLKLNDDTIAGGGDLRGTVSVTPGWSTKLLLVDSFGYINNVSKYLTGTDTQTFDIPHLSLTSPDPVPMLVVAIATEGPLLSAAIDQTDYASTVFRKISKEISGQSLPVSVGMKYFQLGGNGKK